MRKRKHFKKTTYPLSDHFDGNSFFNPGMDIHKRIRHVLKMLAGRRGKEKWPKQVKNHSKPQLAPQLSLDKTHITYINHASHLIQLQNLNIITDPIYAKRAGPASILGPKRVRDPGISLKELPAIDVVLISHNHFDHMNLPTLVKLKKLCKPLFIVPLGNRKYLERKRIENVIELDWWQNFQLNDQQSITLVPALHWSMRKVGDRNKALWGGFWIQSGEIKIYFAGDTGYGPHFKEIQRKFDAPDISILPIGSYEPRWFMKQQHINPEEAVLAHLDLQSRLSIATHHQTFRLSYEGYYEPVNDLKKSMIAHGVDEKSFLAPENGETVIF
jgi:L-ascorbate metabolism protein UlaG (beta-lactamase superfamily)